jgi:hypothetical protein
MGLTTIRLISSIVAFGTNHYKPGLRDTEDVRNEASRKLRIHVGRELPE